MDLLKTIINLLCIAFGLGVSAWLVISSRKALKKAEAEARAEENNKKQIQIIREHLAANKENYGKAEASYNESLGSVEHLLGSSEPEPARPSEPSEFRKDVQ